MVGCLECAPPATRARQPAHGMFKKHSVHSVNGYLALFRAEEGEGGVEKEWHPTSVTSLPVQVDAKTTTSPLDNLHLCPRQYLPASQYVMVRRKNRTIPANILSFNHNVADSLNQSLTTSRRTFFLN